jgi:hypothetical protein
MTTSPSPLPHNPEGLRCRTVDAGRISTASIDGVTKHLSGGAEGFIHHAAGDGTSRMQAEPRLPKLPLRGKPVLNAVAATFGDRWPAAELY